MTENAAAKTEFSAQVKNSIEPEFFRRYRAGVDAESFVVNRAAVFGVKCALKSVKVSRASGLVLPNDGSPQVVEPDFGGVVVVRIAARKKQHVSFDALRVENPSRQAQNYMKAA